MGGCSSGRVGWRAKCEDRLSIDVRRWARGGHLSRAYFGWEWTVNGEKTSNIGVYGHDDRIELSYTKDGEQYRYPVMLTETPCHLGGARRWFLCPAVRCQRRAAKLYLGDRYFACRRCYNLAYKSQSESIFDRAFRQAEKIKCAIGGEPGMDCPLPEKPKRMRWRTYKRLRERYERYEQIVDYSWTRFAKRWPELFKDFA